jgi:cell division protein FtsZ
VRVTVIAAGFDGGEPNTRPAAVDGRRASYVEAGSEQAQAASSAPFETGEAAAPAPAADSWQTGESPAAEAAPQKDPAFDDENDDLDIPDFLK